MPGFFDKVKAGIGEKAAEASIRSREAFDTQQTKMKIGDLEGQKRTALAELGAVVYEMYQKSAFDPETLAKPCESISAFDAQIKEKEAELEEIHRRAEQALAAQANSDQPAAAGGAHCPQCGVAIAGSPKFCPSCGNKLA